MNNGHTCYREIVTQHRAWQQAVDEVSTKADALLRFFEEKHPDEIIFVGCGSPLYLGESVAGFWQTALGVRTRAVAASEIVLYPDAYLPPENSSPLLVAVSRSGATTETLWAVEQFEGRFPGRTFFVGCAPDSPLAERAAFSITMPSAHEQTVPQTRSFAAMFLATQMAGAVLGGREEIVDILRGAPSQAGEIIARWEETAAQIGRRTDCRNAFYLGSGPLYGIAREGALKMAEMSISEAFAYQFMESRHGPRSLVDELTLVVGLHGRTAPLHEARVMAELVRDSEPVSVALTPTADWDTGGARIHIPLGLNWPDAVVGLAYLPILHLIAYYRAVARGVNPDTSRNLVIYVDLDENTQ
jgi:glucosamine--fructose-6-phosphate aminotransferase (isomerizing)